MDQVEAVARTALNDTSVVIEEIRDASVNVAHCDVLFTHVSVIFGVISLLFRKRVPIITL